MKSMKTCVLEALMKCESATIVNLSEELKLSVPSVNKCVCALKEDGLAVELGLMESQRGRKPMLYSVNPDASCFVGVDIKKHHITMMAMDLAGKCIGVKNIDNDNDLYNSHAAMEQICDNVKKFISDSGIGSKVKMVSYNISGRVNAETGESYSFFKFEGDDAPLSEILSQKIGFPVVIENDTRAMAYAELIAGELSNYKNALFINFSWGIGMSVLADGRLYVGADGFAGELGHMYAYNNNIICHCGKRGCLETEVSMNAISRKIAEQIHQGKKSSLEKELMYSTLTPGKIADAVNDGDPLAMEVVEEVARELGKHLANLINIFNPEAVILGGTMAVFTDYFLLAIRQAIMKYGLRLVCSRVVIEQSKLDDNAGALGACFIARKRCIEGIE